VLVSGGKFFVYGPLTFDGEFRGKFNAAFDERLKDE
jgi:hypothetical protein